MKKTSVIPLATASHIAALLAASSAFAAQNVANTSQKGSLLIWPLITVDHSDPNDPQDTIVEISNDANASIHVECEYVNEEKGRVNFDFELTAKQTVSLGRLHPGRGSRESSAVPDQLWQSLVPRKPLPRRAGLLRDQ